MAVVYYLLLALHMIGLLGLLGTWIAAWARPRVLPGTFHSALTQLVTGVLMVTLRDTGLFHDDEPIDHVKFGVKLVVAIVVTVLAWRHRNMRESAPVVIVHLIGGLTVLNVIIALVWH